MKANTRKTLHGVTISHGLVVGRFLKFGNRPQISEPHQESLSPDLEWSNFIAAQGKAIERIENLLLASEVAPHRSDLPFVLKGYIFLLTDILIVEGIKRLIFEEHVDARSAIKSIFSDAEKKVGGAESLHVQEKSLDLSACEEFLLNALDSEDLSKQWNHLKGRIVVIDQPTPQDIIRFQQAAVAGIVAESGTHLSHAAILARSFNIPALFSVQGILENSTNGQTAILNSEDETLIINPSRAEVRKTAARRVVDLMLNQKLRAKSSNLARTTDGHRIIVCSNADGPIDARNILSFGAEGIGLLRTEFLHLNASSMPSVHESGVFFRLTASAFAPQWFTVRLLDAGGDKPYPFGHLQPSTQGPFGLRGIRYLLSERIILENQLSALIRANTLGNIRILIPFVTDVNEVRQVKELMRKLWLELSKEERVSVQFPQIGAMIETPAACQILDHLCSECDFLSVGSNDLTQHTLCMDRNQGNAVLTMSSLHPAVLRTLKMIFEMRKKTDMNICLCGELASDPSAIELLIGLGCRQLSARTAIIPMLKDIIRNLNLAQAESLASTVLCMSNTEDIQALLINRFERNFEYSLVTHAAQNQAG